MQIGITERGDGGLSIQKVLKVLQEKQVAGAIIVTKFPKTIVDLPERLPDNTIVHCTITGHGGTLLEAGVKHWKITIAHYWHLVENYGPERVVLRVDPIIPTKAGLDLALKVINEQAGRVRISFLDLYPHVYSRLSSIEYIPIKKMYGGKLHAPLNIRQDCLKKIQEIAPDVEVCGEPGLNCTGCVSSRDIVAMGLTLPERLGEKNIRPGCHCLAAKVELLTSRHPCVAKCKYCYWKDRQNTSL